MNFELLLQENKNILSQGSIYEMLRRSPEVVLDKHIFHAGLIYDKHHSKVLENIFRSYIDIAINSKLPISVLTATWRANKQRIKASTFSNKKVNEDNVEFLSEIRSTYNNPETRILIAGDIGPKGDAYKPNESLDKVASQEFHSHQINALK